ncbi:hypothetical protein ACQB6R_00600 [Propionibacteriaceae bacterium G1746]|uniref:hypothetical protein n=1 Tax=Aestuariimicrobium sp. G57 TaxID=3418485 RepID=UPI003C1C79F9
MVKTNFYGKVTYQINGVDLATSTPDPNDWGQVIIEPITTDLYVNTSPLFLAAHELGVPVKLQAGTTHRLTITAQARTPPPLTPASRSTHCA